MPNETMNLLELTPSGLYCPQADVFIDPWRPVEKAVITHAHADHSRYGMNHYLAHHILRGDETQVGRYFLGYCRLQ